MIWQRYSRPIFGRQRIDVLVFSWSLFSDFESDWMLQIANNIQFVLGKIIHYRKKDPYPATATRLTFYNLFWYWYKLPYIWVDSDLPGFLVSSLGAYWTVCQRGSTGTPRPRTATDGSINAPLRPRARRTYKPRANAVGRRVPRIRDHERDKCLRP